MSGAKLITNLHTESPYVKATGLNSIAIDKGRFTEIEDLPLEAEVIDVDHAFVLPGFVDNHTHLGQPYNSTYTQSGRSSRRLQPP